MAGGRGLVAVPISACLRYWVPPHEDAHELRFDAQARALAAELQVRIARAELARASGG